MTETKKTPEQLPVQTQKLVSGINLIFAGIQACLGILYSLSEQFLLLRQQLSIGRVEFQQLFHVFELCLRIFDALIDILQSFG